MDIELYDSTTKAIISTKGGYVTNLADDDGDILFPKRILKAPDGSEKTRGGCHVCLPNFGPGGESGLEQHGYGRTSEWTVVERSETRVELSLAGQGEYENMDSFLTYEVQENAFTMQLELKNKGKSSLKVAPAFHPYFFCAGSSPVIDGEHYSDLAEFIGTRFIEGTEVSLKLASRTLTLNSRELMHWAEWTDQLGDYFCVEPTRSGNAFLDDISRADELTAECARVYNFEISW